MLYTSSTDPAALTVLAQLEGVGCPPPSEIQEISVATPDGLNVWKESHWVWNTPKGEYDCDIYLGVQSPKSVQQQLIDMGVPGIQPRIGTLTSPIGPTPVPTVVPTTAPISPTTSPIGNRRVDGTFDYVGSWNFPLGYVWKQGGVSYTLGGDPFNEHWSIPATA